MADESGAVGRVVFPARAGMSPHAHLANRTGYGFPRTRGDEPPDAYSQAMLSRFSPHARG